MQIRHNLRSVEFLGIYENGNANILSGMEFLGIIGNFEDLLKETFS